MNEQFGCNFRVLLVNAPVHRQRLCWGKGRHVSETIAISFPAWRKGREEDENKMRQRTNTHARTRTRTQTHTGTHTHRPRTQRKSRGAVA